MRCCFVCWFLVLVLCCFLVGEGSHGRKGMLPNLRGIGKVHSRRNQSRHREMMRGTRICAQRRRGGEYIDGICECG